tara:strand:+ start:9688 stop:11223 length:1536 start_codon:yes stop_codon:yes gene_type:complete
VNVHKIRYKDTSFFSKLVENYTEKSIDESMYNRYPSLSSFSEQIKEKSKQCIDRDLLVSVLKKQNKSINLSEESLMNIEFLSDNNTFTITTGHQLCLFTGPLYFIYKIISTINLAERLKKEFCQYNFVPIFWMASEDHDFTEVNHIHLYGKKFIWESNERGIVGNFKTKKILRIIDEIDSFLGSDRVKKSLVKLLKRCYSKDTLSEATRDFVNELFGEYGLVIMDSNDKYLKQKLIPIMKEDIIHQSLAPVIKKNSDINSKLYKNQAFVRNINFFKISEGKRERVLESVSENEIDNNPEKFSPNVLIRPLYQELILPNLCYVGGGAEISYWMQLKSVFHQQDIVFPILLLRNSVMWIEEKDYKKINNLGFDIENIFLSTPSLEKMYVQRQSEINLLKEKLSLENLYRSIDKRTHDQGLKSLIKSDFVKNLKSLEKIEKKLIRSEKQKHENSLNQIRKIKRKLFPNNQLQERIDNLIAFYNTYGEKFIKTLKEELDPLDSNFLILSPLKDKK